VHKENLESNCTHFHDILYRGLSLKFVETFYFWLKLYKTSILEIFIWFYSDLHCNHCNNSRNAYGITYCEYNCTVSCLILKALHRWSDDRLCSPKRVDMLRYKQMYMCLKDLWRIDWKVVNTQRYVLYKINNNYFKRILNAIRDASVRNPSLTHKYCLLILATDLHSINRSIGHGPL
jgi:hypothetical protein